jgi:hypothetical protein
MPIPPASTDRLISRRLFLFDPDKALESFI